ncbi:protoporphyrinogen/coproporphyrinogen oxidase [Actinomyces marmotae]|uniref:NAD(P)-binding protein n=2 Tax=Actinomyces marmotae TaxID=2737173 RepID=A0A6M8AX46_9ACTO|nr:FAD-dependent oxidoreductase [Actinomyces marmotae]QKD78949.1 NAD(P)-binding protein [Actinomyces marmotae]
MSAAGARGGRPSPASPPSEVDELVVGGGIAGLTAAWELTRAGLRPLLVEARGYTGGLIAGGEIGGVAMDLGAESVVLRGGAVTTMLDALGLEATAHRGRPGLFLPPMAGSGPAVADDGAGGHSPGGWALHPFPREAILGIPADPLSDDTIAILGEAGARRAARDGELAAGVGASPSDPRDLASLVRARMGEAVLDRLVRPIVAGIHASDPAVLDADVVMPGLRADVIRLGSLQAAIRARLEERRSRPAGQRSGEVCVVGGMHRLTAALRAAIESAGGTVLTRWGAQGMRLEDGAGITGAGGRGPWRVALAPTGRGATPSDEPIAVGAPREVRARRVVLACSAPAALRLLAGAPGLDPDALSIPIPSGAPIARLTIVARAPGLAGAPVGSGLLVAPAPPSSAPCPVAPKALSHLDAKWPWIAQGLRDRHGEGVSALRLSYGRPGGPRPEPALAGALDDIAALTGARIDLGDVLDHRLVRWDGTLPPAMPDYRRRTALLEEAVAGLPRLSVTGAWVAGTGIAAVIAHARERAAGMVGPAGAQSAEPGGQEED